MSTCSTSCSFPGTYIWEATIKGKLAQHEPWFLVSQRSAFLKSYKAQGLDNLEVLELYLYSPHVETEKLVPYGEKDTHWDTLLPWCHRPPFKQLAPPERLHTFSYCCRKWKWEASPTSPPHPQPWTSSLLMDLMFMVKSLVHDYFRVPLSASVLRLQFTGVLFS